MGRIRRASAVLAAVLLCSLVLTGCGASGKHSETYYTYFDTVTTVTMIGSARDFDAVCAIVEPMLERYHRAGDIYHEYGGEVNACTLNRNAGKGPIYVSAELMELLSFGKEMYDVTGGKCNIAMGAVFSLWHDCREAALAGEAPRLPSDAALLTAAQHSDIRDLRLDPANLTAELSDEFLRIDLGAVAKGYAAERIAQALEAAGYTHIALNVGGNVRTVGGKSAREGCRSSYASVSSSFLGKRSAAAEEIPTVSAIVRVPAEREASGASAPAAQLAANPTTTHRATARSFFIGGMMMARNMP